MRTWLPGANEVSDTIRRAEHSTLRVYYAEDGWCSATRVTEELVLTAAHCFLGFEGGKSPDAIGAAFIITKDRREPLELVEAGAYDLAMGKMQDWILFRPTTGPDALDGVAIAGFPDAEDIAGLLADLGDFSEFRSGAPVWAITYPQRPLHRKKPRESF